MPIDKRKITNVANYPTWLSSIHISMNAFYLFLIFISLAWNVYNTHQYQILAERQLKFENILAEILPPSSLQSFNQIPTSSTFKQWMTSAFALLKQFTFNDDSTNSSSPIVVQPSTVSTLFWKCSLRTLTLAYVCTYIYISMYGSCQGRTRLFQTCITN
ncbi:unnamed protein product [Adineta ricciae]|uniref:Uncharacterized protein n=1 Tax=Adineta ricciae TaxID=249248 RepID=A0A816AHJ0_ADIRI|nr:unnamed protein product [Adineta ricciae]